MNRRNFILSFAAWMSQSRKSPAFGHALQNDARLPDRELRDRLMEDTLRTQYRLLPQTGFIGDLTGLANRSIQSLAQFNPVACAARKKQ